MWQESEDDDAKFSGEIEFKEQNEWIKCNSTIQKHVTTLKHEFKKLRLVEEPATIRVSFQMSTILAGAVMALIGFECIAKHFGSCGIGKNTSGQEYHHDLKDEEQQPESKDDEKEVNEQLALTNRKEAIVRKLDRIEISGHELLAKMEGSKVICFSCFSSEPPSKGTHLSIARCSHCLLIPKTLC